MREFFSFISLFHFIIAFVCVCVSAVVVEWFECLKTVIWFEREGQNETRCCWKKEWPELEWTGETDTKTKGWGLVMERKEEMWWLLLKEWLMKRDWGMTVWKEQDEETKEWMVEKMVVLLFWCESEWERMNCEMCGIEWVVERTREVGWLKSSGWFDDEMREVFNLLWRWMEWCG